MLVYAQKVLRCGVFCFLVTDVKCKCWYFFFFQCFDFKMVNKINVGSGLMLVLPFAFRPEAPEKQTSLVEKVQ